VTDLHAVAPSHALMRPCFDIEYRMVLQGAGIGKREVGRIMQKLGQKGTTEEGLMDLHRYMQKHPHLKLEQIMNLSVASTTFRKYLEDGLKKAAYRDKVAKGGELASCMPLSRTMCSILPCLVLAALGRISVLLL